MIFPGSEPFSSESGTSDVGAGQGCGPSSRGNIIDRQAAKRAAECGVDASVASALPLSGELSGLERLLSLLRPALLEGPCGLFRTLDSGLVSHCRSFPNRQPRTDLDHTQQKK